MTLREERSFKLLYSFSTLIIWCFLFNDGTNLGSELELTLGCLYFCKSSWFVWEKMLSFLVFLHLCTSCSEIISITGVRVRQFTKVFVTDSGLVFASWSSVLQQLPACNKLLLFCFWDSSELSLEKYLSTSERAFLR